jgi:hypothetical protein
MERVGRQNALTACPLLVRLYAHSPWRAGGWAAGSRSMYKRAVWGRASIRADRWAGRGRAGGRAGGLGGCVEWA